MERNILKWSCNKSKFTQVIVEGRYKEILGHLFNITWELEILYFGESLEDIYPVWNICLNRDKEHEERFITTKLLSCNQVLLNERFHFPSGTSKYHITKYVPETLVNYCLELFIIVENNEENDETVEEEYQIVELQDLSTRFQKMFEKEHMTDIILKCDSLSLKAHKSVLSIQSPVFEAMFSSPMLESELNTMTVKDMDPSAFRAMVSFMYSGKVKVESEAMAYDLLYAAEKYQIGSLKKGCSDYLKSILSQENVIKILEISNLFDQKLKLHCLSYVKDRFQELKSSKDFKELKLKSPVLALEVYSYNDDE